MTPESLIVRDFAAATCKRIARRVRIKLQRMGGDCLLSGDDSVLKNVWEEICVQLQSQESFAWTAYEETVTVLVQGYLNELQRHELEAIWLQTDDAFDSIDPTEQLSTGSRPAIFVEAVRDYLIKEYIYPLASDWSNVRIQQFLDRPSD